MSGSPYEVLGVPVDVSRVELAAAYRRYVREHHPDRGGDSARFQAGVEAYRTLIEPPVERVPANVCFYQRDTVRRRVARLTRGLMSRRRAGHGDDRRAERR